MDPRDGAVYSVFFYQPSADQRTITSTSFAPGSSHVVAMVVVMVVMSISGGFQPEILRLTDTAVNRVRILLR